MCLLLVIQFLNVNFLKHTGLGSVAWCGMNDANNASLLLLSAAGGTSLKHHYTDNTVFPLPAGGRQVDGIGSLFPQFGGEGKGMVGWLRLWDQRDQKGSRPLHKNMQGQAR